MNINPVPYVPMEILETIPVHHYEIGKRIQLKLQYVSCTESYNGYRSARFGKPIQYRLKFRDETGRLYVWDTSATTKYDFDKNWFLLIGTVEGFAACNGEYLTVLKNCKYTKF